jgi:hypothetical protein
MGRTGAITATKTVMSRQDENNQFILMLQRQYPKNFLAAAVVQASATMRDVLVKALAIKPTSAGPYRARRCDSARSENNEQEKNQTPKTTKPVRGNKT